MELLCKNPLAYSRNKSALGFFEHASFQLWNCCNFWVDTQPVMETSFESEKKSEAPRITFKSTSVRKQNPLRGKMEASIKQRKRFRGLWCLCTASFTSIFLKWGASRTNNTSISGSVNYPRSTTRCAKHLVTAGRINQLHTYWKPVAVNRHVKIKKKVQKFEITVIAFSPQQILPWSLPRHDDGQN